MTQVCTIGMDIAKNKFQVHGEDQHGKRIFSRQLLRKDVLTFFANLPACLVGLEACGGAHYWARELVKMGHDARLIPPRQVKPFVINNKTDAADARAICEVVRRPSTKFVSIKTVDQQQLMALHKVRERLVGNRTALVNQIRALLHEIGIVIPQGIAWVRRELPLLIAPDDMRLSAAFKQLFMAMHEELRELDTRVGELEKQLISMAKADEDCTRLMRIPGVGVLTATAVTAHMGNARHFKNGRQFAACLGLTPREYSSGGKQKLLGISKRGNAYIRKLLIQGARSLWLFWQYKQPQEDRRAQWMQEVAMRRGKFVAIVAQANKTARILWNVLAKSEEYRQDYSIA